MSDRREYLLSVALTAEELELLAVLGRSEAVRSNGTSHVAAAAALRHLAWSAIDGVRRPGSWERQWLSQAFGEDWTDALEQERPKKGSQP